MSLSGIEKFRAPYEGALKKFEAYFQSQVGQFEPELKETVADVLKHPGKRLRPMFVLGVAGLAEAQKERSWKIAAIVEFIHLATLVHDDILDSAQTRHGATSHYIKFGPQVSVLTGDTLFLRANELAATEEDVRVGRLVAAAAKATCSGEIAQSLTARENIRISYESAPCL